jgi:flagellar protein FlbD
MIELTQLNGKTFTLNSDLIETLENIPETKVLLTNGQYYIVRESRAEIVRRIIGYKRRIFRNESARQRPAAQPGENTGRSAKDAPA